MINNLANETKWIASREYENNGKGDAAAFMLGWQRAADLDFAALAMEACPFKIRDDRCRQSYADGIDAYIGYLEDKGDTGVP
jgi:hypothetical protein